FLMYVDESGDCGLVDSPTEYFILSGLVIHESKWYDTLGLIRAFRHRVKNQFGMGMRDEFHASRMISRPGDLVRIKRHHRLTIIRNFADLLGSIPEIDIINVVVDKRGKPETYNVFEVAWKTLIQRLENTILRRNFSGSGDPNEKAMLFPDQTDVKKLTSLVRKMRRYNPVPDRTEVGTGYRNLMLTTVVEDPNFRDSAHSYFIQAVDLTAYLLYQHLKPSAYVRKKSGQNYFLKLESNLCKVASSKDPMGIVRL
ncbi:MAG: DUF3800 domain-containing protein, partial [Candidatus Omnitrophica bacterium]|nr:DUF3800 domain-containing protein [Candidatus Omnitrophota bacterium]